MDKLLTKIYDILGNAMSKQVGSTISFNSTSRQCHEIWALQFHFFAQFEGNFLLVRLAFLITLTGLWLRLSNNLSLVCPSLHPLLEVTNPDLKPSSSLMFKNDLCQILVVGHWHRSITWKLELSHQDSRKTSSHASNVSTNSRRKGAEGMVFLMCCSLQLQQL